MKDDYIRHVIEDYLIGGHFDANFGSDWVDSARLDQIMHQTADLAFAAYGIDAKGQYFSFSAEIIMSLIKAGAIADEGDEYAGFWFKLKPVVKVKVIQNSRDSNPATKRVELLGEEALRRALVKIVKEDGLQSPDSILPDSGILSDALDDSVPASDRIVSISHNQVTEIEKPLDEIVELVETENSIDGVDDLRELTIGRLRAGRELIKAGIFSVKSLYLTLIVGLRMLVEKYKDAAIGYAATKLLDILINHLGIV